MTFRLAKLQKFYDQAEFSKAGCVVGRVSNKHDDLFILKSLKSTGNGVFIIPTSFDFKKRIIQSYVLLSVF